MNRGFYHAANGMIINQRALNTASQNISNSNTSGYKSDKLVTNTFKEQLILVQRRNALSGTFEQTYVDNTHTDLEQGSFEFTSSPFDVAINGNVYFNIRGNNGDNYLSRNGQWELDDEGYLTLGNSGRILGEEGEIYVGTSDFAIDNQGNVIVDGQTVDTLLLTYIAPDAEVEKYGENLLIYQGDGTIPDNEEFDIIQGAYERSNIDLNKEILSTMEIQRHYEANSSILKNIDSLNASSASLSKI
ncbi:MAG: flagellar hook-basal body complex protein [Clostridiales bacterium]|mgnify:FL=1|nr:flagellar hook-basal body complex protein [Clostridiales bacterium]